MPDLPDDVITRLQALVDWKSTMMLDDVQRGIRHPFYPTTLPVSPPGPLTLDVHRRLVCQDVPCDPPRYMLEVHCS